MYVCQSEKCKQFKTRYSDSWIRSQPKCRWCQEEFVREETIQKNPEAPAVHFKGSDWPSKDLKKGY